MESPYKNQLRKLRGKKATIHRADSENLTGTIKNIGNEGCTIQQPCAVADSIVTVFVAYCDMRGVASLDWDLENL